MSMEVVLVSLSEPELERQDSAEDEQNMTAGAPVVGSSSVSIEINGNTKEVQDKIESCLQLYMNKEDVVKTLFQLDGIDPGVTTSAWNQLEEEKPEIFKDFYTKLILEEPSSTSNQLLEQQDDLENLLACLDDPFASIDQDFQHVLVDTLPWGETIPIVVPIPSGDPYIDSLSTVSCRQLVNDENPASDSFHPAQMNFERLMVMDRNAADIAPVPFFINLEILNPASVAGNDQTEAEHDPILSCLNSPKPPGPVFGNSTDISGSSIFHDPPEPNFNPGSAILPDLPGSNFNPRNSILPDTPETNSHPDFGTLLDPPNPKIDVDDYFNVSSLALNQKKNLKARTYNINHGCNNPKQIPNPSTGLLQIDSTSPISSSLKANPASSSFCSTKMINCERDADA